MQIGKTTFTETKFQGLDGKDTVAFVADDSSLTLRATRASLIIEGHLELDDEVELQNFAKLVSLAWTAHKKILQACTKKLTQNIAGH